MLQYVMLLLSYDKKEEKEEKKTQKGPTTSEHNKSLRNGESPKRLNLEQELFLRLIMSGVSIEDARVQLKRSDTWSYKLLISAAAQNYMEGLRSVLDVEFEGLYRDVIDCIKTGLGHSEPTVYLSAASLWLRTNKVKKVSVDISAEDVVRKIIDGEVVSVSDA